jgi:hypothetical protein
MQYPEEHLEEKRYDWIGKGVQVRKFASLTSFSHGALAFHLLHDRACLSRS